jgi:antitoxin (DNA-binding transcriptional repressor) of toxin-antitoxin stability system
MRSIADLELPLRVSELLKDVENGEVVSITRGGAEVARLVPAMRPPRAPDTTPEKAAAAIEHWLAVRGDWTLGMPIKDAINEGRP